MQPLKILEYITASTVSGAENLLLGVARELQRRGHSLLLVSPQGRKLTEVIRQGGFDLWTPRTRGKLDPVTLWKVRRLIHQREIQIVHTHLSTASILGGLAARRAGVPSVATVHGLNSAFCYRFSTLIVAVSEAVRQHLVSQNVPEGRIRVIPNSIDVNHFQALPAREQSRNSLGLRPEDRVVLFVGRITAAKGVRLLPEIVQRLRAVIPNARMLVVGEGALQSELQQTIHEKELDDTLMLMGRHPDVRPYLAAADLVLLPSYAEGLPMTLLEAMAAGLPAVGTDAGGIPEAIAAGKTGEIAPVGDAASLAAACARILRDPVLFAGMSINARDRVRSLFSVETGVNRLEAVFAEAIEMQASLR